MLRTSMPLLLLGILLGAFGCAESRQEPIAVTEQPLTAAVAKQALLAMDGRQSPSGVLVPLPEDDPIEIFAEGKIAVGPYHCNLEDKTFNAWAFYPNALRHKKNHVKGVFERNAEGTWVAKVTFSLSSH